MEQANGTVKGDIGAMDNQHFALHTAQAGELVVGRQTTAVDKLLCVFFRGRVNFYAVAFKCTVEGQ